MRLKAPLLPCPNPAAGPLIQAYFELNHLKQLYRQGWLRRAISPAQCESVAEHTFGVALLALFLADSHFPALDPLKLVRMALLHDLGEIYAGDMTPADNVPAAEKHRLEAESVQRVLGKLPHAQTYLALWDEFEQGQSAEAQVIKQLDRLEMALQAVVYEQQSQVTLSEFFDTAQAALTTPALLALFAEILSLRK